jgi:HK97 family phage prohead protease
MATQFVTRTELEDALAATARGIGQAVREATGARGAISAADSKTVRHVDLRVTKFVAGSTARTIEGMLSTGDLDRQGDIVAPLGMRVKLPISLLAGHDHSAVIGVVNEARASAQGVFIRAQIVTGTARADEAWQLVQQGALTYFSAGFLGIEREPIPTGWLWKVWELVEASLVAVPANANARLSAHSGAKSGGSIRLIRPGIPLIRSTR